MRIPSNCKYSKSVVLYHSVTQTVFHMKFFIAKLNLSWKFLTEVAFTNSTFCKTSEKSILIPFKRLKTNVFSSMSVMKNIFWF